MTLPNCPEWEYTHHPRREIILKRKSIDLLVQLRHQEIDSLQSAIDTRSIHRHLFLELVPPRYEYFAGHYRGEDFPCLKNCGVGVSGDRRVGANSDIVLGKMSEIAQTLHFGIALLDSAKNLPPVEHLLATISFACQIFDRFLRVHPYANGNGHVARFTLWAILGRYDYWLKNFPIEPRPQDTSYIDCLHQYRNGQTQPLEKYILTCLIGRSQY